MSEHWHEHHWDVRHQLDQDVDGRTWGMRYPGKSICAWSFFSVRFSRSFSSHCLTLFLWVNALQAPERNESIRSVESLEQRQCDEDGGNEWADRTGEGLVCGCFGVHRAWCKRRELIAYVDRCTSANDWYVLYHFQCVGLSVAQAEKAEKYTCIRCGLRNSVQITASYAAKIANKWYWFCEDLFVHRAFPWK